MEAVNSLDEAVRANFGDSVKIVSRTPIQGGDINEAYRLSLSDGEKVFLKCNRRKNLPFFQAEEKGLDALRASGAIGVPKALALGTDGNRSFLLMEYMEAGSPIPGYWQVFGRELAEMHRWDWRDYLQMGEGKNFGFPGDNYIGASPQVNTPKETWIDFYRECRLLPQIHMAGAKLDFTMRRQLDRILERLDTLLTEPEFPSLIHGDLWGGNASCGPDGKAWIYDPAAYVGHFEAELAMTELFGGFPDSFYRAYREVIPLDEGYRDRRDLYQLYHLLNHLNLFGGGYRGSVKRILDRYA